MDFMPKLVLRVSRGLDKVQYTVSLHFPTRTTKKAYLALSYCWGGAQPHQTTKTRIKDRKHDLDYKALPKSIQDAIKVTVGLGFEFLWVDSLCIVQDDDIEKAKQIALMPQIYFNATVTIIASKATRAVDGFLDEIDPRPQIELAVKIPFCSSTQSSSVSKADVRTGSAYIVRLKEDAKHQGINRVLEPIDTRGWCFQERYLSARALEFGTHQVKLICPSCIRAAESPWVHHPSDGWKLASHVAGLQGARTFHQDTQTGPLVNSDRDRRRIERDFYDMVETYSKRTLSFTQDRILAMSGIAERFRQRLQDDYFVGFWKRSLPCSLLWRISDASSLWPRPARYQAPSWSWAAVNGGVTFNLAWERDWTTGISQLEVKTELVEGSAACGAVHSGRITGCGRLRSVLWPRAEWNYKSAWLETSVCVPAPGQTTRKLDITIIPWVHASADVTSDDFTGPDVMSLKTFDYDSSASEEDGEQDDLNTQGNEDSTIVDQQTSESRNQPWTSGNAGFAFDLCSRLELLSPRSDSSSWTDDRTSTYLQVYLLQVGIDPTQESGRIVGLVLRAVDDSPGQETGDSSAHVPHPVKRYSRIGTFEVDEKWAKSLTWSPLGPRRWWWPPENLPDEVCPGGDPNRFFERCELSRFEII